jgi:L-ascorbate metabolism protein UlaG (beta-lactamase superfamily)
LIKNSKIIYIDPYNLKEGLPKADMVLISHSHYDHCSFGDLKKIVQEGTRIICPADCQSKITRFDVPIKMELVEPFQELSFGDIGISTIPAYNVDKHFHPKGESWIGYLVKMENVLIYHAGDTDLIPEMQKLTGYKQPGKEFVALLPIGGRFTMNVEEAAEAAKLIKPTIAIPMHWGSIVGSEDDAQEFKELCEENKINVKILEKI